MPNTIVQLADAVNVNAAGPVADSAQSTTPIGANDYTVKLQLSDLQASRVRIGIEDSTDGATWVPFAVWEITGPASQDTRGQRSYHAPGLKTAAGAQARLNVYEITGGSAIVSAAITAP